MLHRLVQVTRSVSLYVGNYGSNYSSLSRSAWVAATCIEVLKEMTIRLCVWPATDGCLLELSSFMVKGLIKASLTVSHTIVLCTYEARRGSNTTHVVVVVVVSCTLSDATATHTRVV